GAGHGVEVERVPAGEAGAEDGGLSEAGGVAGAREGILTHERDAALEQVRGALGNEVPHLRCLAALAGEKRDRGSGVGDQGHTNTLSGGYKRSQRSQDIPPSRGVRFHPPAADISRLCRASRTATAAFSEE